MGIGKGLVVLSGTLILAALLVPYGVHFAMRSLMSTPLDPTVGNVQPVNERDLIAYFRLKNVLVVGATRGIGRGIAICLAALGANVRVVGRSRSGGEAVVQRMAELAAFPEEQEFKAYSYDMSSVKGALKFIGELEQDDYHMDHLVMTIGAWPDWKSPLSADGIDKVFSLDVVARFVVFTKAARLLKADARVMNVLASTQKMFPPGVEEMKSMLQGEKVDGGLKDILSTAATAADAFLIIASDKYPNIAFSGTHPGIIDTELTKTTFPEWLENLKTQFLTYSGVAITEEQCGMIHAQILASPNMRKDRATFFNSYYDARKATAEANHRDFGLWLWKFAEEFVETHSSS